MRYYDMGRTLLRGERWMHEEHLNKQLEEAWMQECTDDVGKVK